MKTPTILDSDREKDKQTALEILGPCRCTVEYTSRGRKDPACEWCENAREFIDALQKVRAEAQAGERERCYGKAIENCVASGKQRRTLCGCLACIVGQSIRTSSGEGK